jgi:tubulin monoglycylase TTLL3/8
MYLEEIMNKKRQAKEQAEIAEKRKAEKISQAKLEVAKRNAE